MENPIKMDDFGGPPIFGNTQILAKPIFPQIALVLCWTVLLRKDDKAGM